MRVLICWQRVSGYAVACWRALAARDGVELHIVCRQARGFDPAIIEGLPTSTIGELEPLRLDWLRERIASVRPDVVLFAGWAEAAYRRMARLPELARVALIMGMDSPWLGTWRQKLGRFRWPGFFRRVDRAFVAGERAWQLARHLGFDERRIVRGVYAADVDTFRPALDQRLAAGEWPRRFLFIGRYVTTKGIDELCAAYDGYRGRVGDPWPLTACGAGERADRLQQTDGIEDRGFVQPRDLPDVLAAHGVFVLPSRFEPWGVVVAEAAAAGLPVICTEQVGASLDLVRSYHNGVVTPARDADALSRALVWMHENHARLPEMGQRSQQMAAAFTPPLWVERFLSAAEPAIAERQAAPAP